MIKPGVDLRGLSAEMVLAYCIAQTIYWIRFGQRCVITSALDGTHSTNSLHYSGKALDLRTNTLQTEQVQSIYLDLKDSLGPQFDVVMEPSHLHVEFDPKEPIPKDV